MKTCQGCDADISHKRAQAKWCSGACRVRVQRKPYIPREKTSGMCEVCGAAFAGIRGKRFCSRLCYKSTYDRSGEYNDRRRDYMREYQRKLANQDGMSPSKRYGEIKPCRLCLTEFHGTKRAKFCSNTCSNLGRSGWTSDTIDWDAFYSGKEQRRAYISQTIRQKVYRRDKYICQICGDACVGTSGRQPLSPSLDHIVPWSLSQDDSEDNLRTAHLLCNMQRGAGVV